MTARTITATDIRRAVGPENALHVQLGSGRILNVAQAEANDRNALATGTCVARTRDVRPCAARATCVVMDDTGTHMNVCGTHRIAFDETASEHGVAAATARVLTGGRSTTTTDKENDRWN